MTSFLPVILAGFLLTGLLAVVLRCNREIWAARQRLVSLGSQVVETSCGAIEYASVGEGCPVLVVHGAIGGFDQGLYLAKILSSLIPDHFPVSHIGHLRSPVPDGANLDLQADFYAGLLDELNIKRVVVYAISAGSTSAIRFAAAPAAGISPGPAWPGCPGKYGISMPPRFVFEFLFRSNFFYWVLIASLRRVCTK